MLTHLNNLTICLACALRDAAVAGPCACRAESQPVDIQVRAKSGKCPREFFDTEAAAAPTRSPEFDWTVLGPLMWGELHRAALDRDGELYCTDFLTKFIARIPCGSCREDFQQLIAANPMPASRGVELASSYAVPLFAWTVDLHNKVSARLGKPTLSPQEALRKWTRSE